jgi:hypothetical protein
MAEPGLFEQSSEPQIITMCLLILHQQSDEFGMGERRLFWVGQPFLKALRQTVQLE